MPTTLPPAGAASAGQERGGNEAEEKGLDGDASDQDAWVDALLQPDPRMSNCPREEADAGLSQSRVAPRSAPGSDGDEGVGSRPGDIFVRPADDGPAPGEAVVAGEASGGAAEGYSGANGGGAAATFSGGSASEGARGGSSWATGGSAAARVTGGAAGSTPSSASDAAGQPRHYALSHDFWLPGLTVAPMLILLPSGRGRSRVPPPQGPHIISQ